MSDEMTMAKRGGSELTGPLLNSIQRGTLSYTYKGIPTLKNPFDWALYPMLLWEVRPRTIIEIGSNRGGSALWLADTMRAFGSPAEIHSIDVKPVDDLVAPGVTFHRGDARRLDEALSPEFMRRLARPLLVIEDSDHQRDTSLAVLSFFHQWLRPGEYIIIEDGIVTELGLAESFDGGPQAALSAFLDRHSDEYEIDARYCDFFGTNVTYAVNGYVRRLGHAQTREETGMSPTDSVKLENVKQRNWFYRFDLPDGTTTQSDVPERILKIHTSRAHHLRRVIERKVAHPETMTAIDFASHEGFFSIELAKYFASVRGFEFRTESLMAARLITDVLNIANVTYVSADLQRMEFDAELCADFVLVYGLIYHMENPIHVLRLASQLSRRHILIETQLFPYDLSGRIEDGSYDNQRQVGGVFGLVSDYPETHTGGSTALALVPSLNTLLFLLNQFGFMETEVLTPDVDDYEQFCRGSRVIVYGGKIL